MRKESKDKPSEINELKQEMHAGFENSRKETGDLRQEMRGGFAKSTQYTDVLRRNMNASIQEIKGSIKDVLDTMNAYATHTDLALFGLKHQIGTIGVRMPTKDYLDEKFFKFSGEMGIVLHKEDDKVNELTGILTEKKVLTKSEAKKIAQIGPSFMKV
ncbi:MAG: hypothetical protein WC750_04360 [Patescibacteria group bacterium]|jgi:hypothetical protein